MDIFVSDHCCGVDEICYIEKNRPSVIVQMVCDHYFTGTNYHTDSDSIVPFLTYMSTRYQNGQELTAFIRKNKLGRVHVSTSRRNLNSGNMLRCYIWEPNERALRKLWKSYQPRHREDEY